MENKKIIKINKNGFVIGLLIILVSTLIGLLTSFITIGFSFIIIIIGVFILSLSTNKPNSDTLRK